MNIYRVSSVKNLSQQMIHFGINFFHFVYNLHLQRKTTLLSNSKDDFSIYSRAQSKLTDEICSIYLQQFESNNPKTNNYGTLIEVFIRLANTLRNKYDEYVPK
jgi:hypothetical protein